MQSLTLDQLTGSSNLLAFADWLLNASSDDPFSLVVVDLQGMLNLKAEVHPNALRWVALILREELPGTLYRTGDDEFVAVLSGPDAGAHRRVVQRLAARLDFEAERLGLEPPAVAIGLVYYSHTDQRSPAAILSTIQALVQAVRQAGAPPVTILEPGGGDSGGVVNALVQRLAALNAQLEASQHLALTDPVTGLPNLRAAYERAATALAQAAANQQSCAILLIDGDNLRRYNQIGYAAGDKLLNDLSITLREQLRPSDFLARWRLGDEFLVILPNTGVSGAASLAERLRRRVESVSQYWPFRVTLSIGVAAYPQHGEAVQQLIEQVEAAKSRAKQEGKNRVIITGHA